jgi:hypothetical protein
VCQLIKAGGGEKKREFIHKSVAERGGIERHEAQQHTHTKRSDTLQSNCSPLSSSSTSSSETTTTTT